MANLKIIISKLESLSIDTQPIRDLLAMVSVGDTTIDTYSTFFDNLNKELSKPYKTNSCPVAINLMMKQLDKRLKNEKYKNLVKKDESHIDPEAVRQIIQESIQNIDRSETREMVDLLRSLMGDIQVIKDKSFLVSKETETTVEPTPIDSEERVFVDPIDNKAKDIKSYVNITSSQGSNISVALDKLRKLKKQ